MHRARNIRVCRLSDQGDDVLPRFRASLSVQAKMQDANASWKNCTMSQDSLDVDDVRTYVEISKHGREPWGADIMQ